jgi:hypothetical protein
VGRRRAIERSKEAETLRRRVHRAALQMLRDGRCHTYRPSSIHWIMGYKARRTAKGLVITYLDYGMWKPTPRKYGLQALAAELLEMCRHPNKRLIWFQVYKEGDVSVEQDRELLLVPRDN